MRFHTFLILFIALLGAIRWYNYDPDSPNARQTRNVLVTFVIGLTVMCALQASKAEGVMNPGDLFGCLMAVLSTIILGGSAVWCSDPVERRVGGVLGLVVISLTSLGLAYVTLKGIT